jgi:hypothetical protein
MRRNLTLCPANARAIANFEEKTKKGLLAMHVAAILQRVASPPNYSADGLNGS